MKPKEYIKKYKLNIQEKFNHEAFIVDFTADLMTTIEFFSKVNHLSYERFKQCVKEIRQKWDSISLKSKGTGLPEGLWKYFYATVVVKIRDEMFGEYLKKKKEAYERKKRYWEYEEQDMFNSFFGNAFHNLFNTLFSNYIPTQEFEILGLNLEANEEEIKESYRKLSLSCHPDKGGSKEEFTKITEAKNKCLMYLKK